MNSHTSEQTKRANDLPAPSKKISTDVEISTDVDFSDGRVQHLRFQWMHFQRWSHHCAPGGGGVVNDNLLHKAV